MKRPCDWFHMRPYLAWVLYALINAFVLGAVFCGQYIESERDRVSHQVVKDLWYILAVAASWVLYASLVLKNPGFVTDYNQALQQPPMHARSSSSSSSSNGGAQDFSPERDKEKHAADGRDVVLNVNAIASYDGSAQQSANNNYTCKVDNVDENGAQEAFDLEKLSEADASARAGADYHHQNSNIDNNNDYAENSRANHSVNADNESENDEQHGAQSGAQATLKWTQNDESCNVREESSEGGDGVARTKCKPIVCSKILPASFAQHNIARSQSLRTEISTPQSSGARQSDRHAGTECDDLRENFNDLRRNFQASMFMRLGVKKLDSEGSNGVTVSTVVRNACNDEDRAKNTVRDALNQDDAHGKSPRAREDAINNFHSPCSSSRNLHSFAVRPDQTFIARDMVQEQNLKAEDTKYCQVCYQDVQLRARHCRVCNKCVATYDHHCTYLGRCIGEKNRILFYAYTTVQTFASAASLAKIVVALTARLDANGARQQAWWAFIAWQIVAALLLLKFVALSLYICGLQTYLISLNLTS